MKFDFVIMISKRNIEQLPLTIQGIRQNNQDARIVLIGSSKLEEECRKFQCDFQDEDTLYPGLTLENTRQLIKSRNFLAGRRTGWYYQQFLKCAYAYICKNEYYMVWDADLIVLKEIDYFDSNDVPYFDVKTEYHKPYFSTINRLFNGRVSRNNVFSFISEHMLMNKKFMIEMLDEICSNSTLKGNTFFEKIIDSVRAVDIPNSGFSEFETYGNYIQSIHPGAYITRNCNSFREGEIFFGNIPSNEELKWASGSFDYICLENRVGQNSEVKAEIDSAMNTMSMRDFVKKFSHLVKYEII